MNFVVGLPESDGFDAICVVVDRFSKMRYFISCHTTIGGQDMAKLFLREIVRLHRLPSIIISD